MSNEVRTATPGECAARIADLEAALRALTLNIDALYGPRAHHLGCICSGTNDGVHSCATLMAAHAAAVVKLQN